MEQEHFFTCQVSNDDVKFKSLKFKVQNLTGCKRLLIAAKKQNKTVKRASFEMHFKNGRVVVWRFNPHWFKFTGNLIPIIKDVQKSISEL